ncbi:MAG: tyrosine-protein phosphatase [Betaproteobacteria bacterium]
MRHTFWLVPGVLAGRSGPCRDPWQLDELKGIGIGAVLSVNDGASCLPDEFERLAIRYRCIPLSPNAPPQEGDIEHCRRVLPLAYDFARANEADGIGTLVHCHAGKDRTGLFLAYYLVRLFGHAPSEAIAKVKAVRSIAFTAEGWEEFAHETLAGTGT